MAEYKKTGRRAKLIVAGCLVERYRGDIRKDMPEVDALIGTNEIEQIVAVCEGIENTDAPIRARTSITISRRAFWPRRGHFAYIKIAEGCDHPCTFCVIPQYRGNVPQPPVRIGGCGSDAAVSARAFARST